MLFASEAVPTKWALSFSFSLHTYSSRSESGVRSHVTLTVHARAYAFGSSKVSLIPNRIVQRVIQQLAVPRPARRVFVEAVRVQRLFLGQTVRRLPVKIEMSKPA